jgi:hypothetical protein
MKPMLNVGESPNTGNETQQGYVPAADERAGIAKHRDNPGVHREPLRVLDAGVGSVPVRTTLLLSLPLLLPSSW